MHHSLLLSDVLSVGLSSLNMILSFSSVLNSIAVVCLRDALELYTAKHDAQSVENEVIISAISAVAGQLVSDWVMFNYIEYAYACKIMPCLA